jgi:hypothetical protein
MMLMIIIIIIFYNMYTFKSLCLNWRVVDSGRVLGAGSNMDCYLEDYRARVGTWAASNVWLAQGSRLRFKCDSTRAETRFGLSVKRVSPFKSAGASVHSTTGSRGVGISVSNAGYTMFQGSVRVLATHSIRQFPFTPPSVLHRVPSGFNWTLTSTDK